MFISFAHPNIDNVKINTTSMFMNFEFYQIILFYYEYLFDLKYIRFY